MDNTPLPMPKHCGWCVEKSGKKMLFGREADKLVADLKGTDLTVVKTYTLPTAFNGLNTTLVISRLLNRLLHLDPRDPVATTILKKLASNKDQ